MHYMFGYLLNSSSCMAQYSSVLTVYGHYYTLQNYILIFLVLNFYDLPALDLLLDCDPLVVHPWRRAGCKL